MAFNWPATTDSIKLHSKQLEIYHHPARFKTLICGRRFGKSTLGVRIVKRAALSARNQNVWAIMPSAGMAKDIWRDLLSLIPDQLINKISQTYREVLLASNSRIRFRSADRPDLLRGASIDYLWVDEAAFVSEPVVNAVLPSLMDRKGTQLLLSTTPDIGGKSHWTYEFFKRGQDARYTDYASWTGPSTDNPHIPPEALDLQSTQLSSERYKLEIMGQYSDDSSAVFDFSGCMVDMMDMIEHQPPYYMGCDFGGKYDNHAIVIIDEVGNVVYSWAGLGDNWQQIWDRIVKLYNDYGKAGVAIDATTAGAPSEAYLKKHIRNLTSVKFTQNSVRDLVHALQRDMENGKVKIIRREHAQLITELSHYAIHKTPSGAPRYGNPKSSRIHDDLVCALMLANWKRSKKSSPMTGSIAADEAADEPKPRLGAYARASRLRKSGRDLRRAFR